MTFPATPVERFTKVRVTGGNYAGCDGYVESDNRLRGPLNFRCVKVMLYEGARQIGCFGFRDTDKLEVI